MNSFYFECFRKCFGWSGQGIADDVPENPKYKVSLDITKMGTDVVIVKNGQRICGTGAALATCPIVQDKAYFESKLQSTGIWGIGLALETTNLNSPLGKCEKAWVLRHDGTVWHNNNKIYEHKNLPVESDVIGVSYDHIEMKFYVNGKPLDVSVTGIKGKVYPVLYVDESAILDVQFSNFYFTPPNGFREIMIEQQIF